MNRFYKYYWRRYGAVPLICCQLIFFENNLILGCLTALWLALPCGIKEVNSNNYLWAGRQFLFAFISMHSILKYFK